MSTKVSVRKCKVCTKANSEEHWRKVTEYGLTKVKNNMTYKHLRLEVSDTLCNSCYCAFVMYDTNKKYQRTAKRKKIMILLITQKILKGSRLFLILRNIYSFVIK